MNIDEHIDETFYFPIL